MGHFNNPYSPNDSPRHNSRTRKRIKMIKESVEYPMTDHTKAVQKQRAIDQLRYSGNDRQFYY